MTDLPNHNPVTLNEAIDWADSHLLPRSGHGGPSLSTWVAETNAEREAAKEAFAVEPITVGDVTFQPGDVLTLHIFTGWKKDKTRRRINCLYLGRSVAVNYSNKPFEQTRWFIYGAKAGGWPQGDAILRSNIALVERVDPVPAWITQAEAERAART